MAGRELYFATTNAGKFNYIRKQLSSHGIELIQAEMDIPEPRSYDIEEIAKQKALFAYEKLKRSVMAQDSGFYIKSYENFPGTFVNFILQTLALEGILRLVSEDRKCEFRMVTAYMDEKLENPAVFESTAPGTISQKPRGQFIPGLHWSILSELFIPDGYEKTHAEMTPEEFERWRIEREKVSHISDFANWFIKERLEKSKNSPKTLLL